MFGGGTGDGLYASVQIQEFINTWPQKAGFPATTLISGPAGLRPGAG